jgi:CubicO group peptidase (beta-lactamase class C family)
MSIETTGLLSTRRSFLQFLALLALPGIKVTGGADPDSLLKSVSESAHLAGVQAALIRNGHVVWSGASGWADIARRIPMTTHTVMNIASVSKTVTAAAVMQLSEAGRVKLDDPINQHLPFLVQNPSHPNTTITVRHLLAHVSSIADGPAYNRSYRCGDTPFHLTDWLHDYLTPGRALYSNENFHPWASGARFAYSNVGFGLLGYLIETVSGIPFDQFCAKFLFAALGMNDTAISIKAFAAGQEAIPYTRSAEATEVVPRQAESRRTLWWVVTEDTPRRVLLGRQAFVPNCLYSFPTAADGLVRTSVLDLSKFLCMLLADGTVEGRTLLTPRGISETFSAQFQTAMRPKSWPAVQGLAWEGYRLADLGLLWGHGGSDPGVATHVLMHFPSKSAALTFANTSPDADAVLNITTALLRIAVSG